MFLQESEQWTSAHAWRDRRARRVYICPDCFKLAAATSADSAAARAVKEAVVPATVKEIVRDGAKDFAAAALNTAACPHCHSDRLTGGAGNFLCTECGKTFA